MEHNQGDNASGWLMAEFQNRIPAFILLTSIYYHQFSNFARNAQKQRAGQVRRIAR